MEKTKDAYVPDFHRLVNYPDYLPKNRPAPGDGMRCCVMCGKPRLCTASSAKMANNNTCSHSKGGRNNNGLIHNNNSSGNGNGSYNGNGINSNKTKDHSIHEDDKKAESLQNSTITTTTPKMTKSFHRNKNTSGPDGGPVHIIPRQNKGLCTVCDVTVWVVTSSNLEIKWCKGCKNFRPWAAFGEKGLATKCVRCRERQREKYALQKEDLKLKRRRIASLNSSSCPAKKPKMNLSSASSPVEGDSGNEEKKTESFVEGVEAAKKEIADSRLSHLIAATNKIDS